MQLEKQITPKLKLVINADGPKGLLDATEIFDVFQDYCHVTGERAEYEVRQTAKGPYNEMVSRVNGAEIKIQIRRKLKEDEIYNMLWADDDEKGGWFWYNKHGLLDLEVGNYQVWKQGSLTEIGKKVVMHFKFPNSPYYKASRSGGENPQSGQPAQPAQAKEAAPKKTAPATTATKVKIKQYEWPDDVIEEFDVPNENQGLVNAMIKVAGEGTKAKKTAITKLVAFLDEKLGESATMHLLPVLAGTDKPSEDFVTRVMENTKDSFWSGIAALSEKLYAETMAALETESDDESDEDSEDDPF